MTSTMIEKLVVAILVILLAFALYSALAQPLADLLNHAATLPK